MIDVEGRLNELYGEYTELASLAESKKQISEELAGIPLLGGFFSKGPRTESIQTMYSARKKIEEITDALRSRVGFYPLAECRYDQFHPLFPKIKGFIYSFHYSLGNSEFAVGFTSQGPLGILAQKHEPDYKPQIEIRREHPHDVLHLPKGFVIPAGPFHFKEDSMPMDEKTQEKRYEEVEEMLKGLNDTERGLFMAGGLYNYLDETRVYPSRYFNWRPILPDTPKYIHFDVQRHHPRSWGLTPETAPTYTKTIEGRLEGYYLFPQNMESAISNCARCKLLSGKTI